MLFLHLKTLRSKQLVSLDAGNIPILSIFYNSNLSEPIIINVGACGPDPDNTLQVTKLMMSCAGVTEAESLT